MDEAAGGNQSPLLFTPTILEQTGRVSRQRMLSISSPSSTIHHARAIILLLWGVLLGFFYLQMQLFQLQLRISERKPNNRFFSLLSRHQLFSGATVVLFSSSHHWPLLLTKQKYHACWRCARHRKHQIWRQRWARGAFTNPHRDHLDLSLECWTRI